MVPEWAEAIFVLGGTIVTVLAYRYGASTRRSAASRQILARVGSITTLLAVAAGSSAAGIVFRDRPTGEGAPVLAWLLMAVAGVGLSSGFALRVGATVKRNIHVVGVRGKGYVRSIREAGPGVKGIPVWEVDLDVAAPGRRPFRTTVREAIPRAMAETVRSGVYVPVLVDDSPVLRVALNWVASPDTRFGGGFAEEAAPDVRPPPPVSVEDPPLAAVASLSIVERLLKVALPMAVLAAAGGLVTFVADSSDDPPVTVSPGAHESTAFGDTISGPGYSFTVPPRWREARVLVTAVAPGADVEVSLDSADFVRASLTVARLPRVGTKLERLLPRLARGVNGQAVNAGSTTVDGERALELDVSQAGGVRTRFVVMRQEADVLVVSLTVFLGDLARAEPALDSVLQSWRWE